MKKTTIENIKTGAGIAVGLGATIIVGNVVKFTTPKGMNLIKKGLVGVASLAISSMISDKVSEYVGGIIDRGIKMAKDIMDEYYSDDEMEINVEVN